MPIYLLLCEVTETNIHWAKKHFPQFWNPQLAPKRQRSYLLSRALLSVALKNYFDLHQIPEIAVTKHNKPYFKDQDITFNLSHSDNFIALIIGQGDLELGIDVEKIQSRKNFSGLMSRVFHEDEKKWILGQSTISPEYPLATLTLKNDEMIRFFLLWSAKEAYLKADGRGIQGLDSLTFHPFQNRIEGDLSEGIVQLSVLTTKDQKVKNSFALYLPYLLKDALIMQTVDLQENLIAFLPLRLSWIMALTD